MNHILFVSPDLYEGLTQTPPTPVPAPKRDDILVGDRIIAINHENVEQYVACDIERIEPVRYGNVYHVTHPDPESIKDNTLAMNLRYAHG